MFADQDGTMAGSMVQVRIDTERKVTRIKTTRTSEGPNTVVVMRIEILQRELFARTVFDPFNNSLSADG